ncbi:MAG: hypothetical protein IKF14_17705 [Atopobiaceae bacterium]|nr:hypothetical protein [Atopobiaceae bacterium]
MGGFFRTPNDIDVSYSSGRNLEFNTCGATTALMLVVVVLAYSLRKRN